MKTWKLAALLGLTSIVSASAGVYVYRTLTVESDEFVAQQQAQRDRQNTLANTLEKSPPPKLPDAAPAGPSLSGAATFSVESKGISSVTFTSDAPLETIVGNTTAATGDITVDVADLSATKGTIEVDLRDLKTGIDMRDEHLLGPKFLNTEAYPKAVFKLTRVEVAKTPVTQARKQHITLHGEFSLRGVTKTVAVDGRVAFYRWNEGLKEVYIKGDVLRIDANFDLELADYGIDPGSLLGKKVANTVKVGLKLTATTAVPILESTPAASVSSIR